MPLISRQDPAVFEVINEAAETPLLLTCDHASRAVPSCLQDLGLEEAHLQRHIAWDIGAADLTRDLARRLGATAILAGYSRLVIDLNRRPGGEGSIAAESDGIHVPGNKAIDTTARQSRIDEIFQPYHDAITALIARRSAKGRAPVVLAMHSFTPVMQGFERPWQVGILWNWDARLPGR